MRNYLSVSTTFVVLLGVPSVASAGFVFTPPSGVTDFRLVFETADSIQPTSPDIATYNDFVTSEAALSLSLPSATWKVIGSTATVNAIANVSCGTACDATVPIYTVDGTLVAASTDAFFSGFVMNTITTDQNGNTGGNYYAWTGTNPDGTTPAGYELGAGATGGYPYLRNWGGYYDYNTFPVLAMSSDISVPEPMSASLLGFGGALLGLFRTRRRRPDAA